MYKKPSSSLSQNPKKPPSRGSTVQVQAPPSTKPKYLPAVQKQKRLQTLPNEIKQKSKDQQMVNIIKQYLLSRGYGRAFQTLKRQKPITPKSNISSSSNNTNRKLTSMSRIVQDQKLLIKYFQRGQRQQFFKHINKWLNLQDQVIGRLQFQLQIYFCIYSVHPMIRKTNTIQKSNLQIFKKFIQNRGSQISVNEEYLTFFSLPYIPKPQQNPGLAHVFTKEWIGMLKEKVSQFIKSQINKIQQQQGQVKESVVKKKVTQLQQIYDKYLQVTNNNQSSSLISLQQPNIIIAKNNHKQSVSQQQLHYYKKQLQQVKTHNQYLIKYIQKLSNSLQQITQTSKMNLLQSNKKWFNFTKDLLKMCKKASKGQKICDSLQKYQVFFGKNVDQIVNNADVSIFDKNSMMVDDNSYLMGVGNKNDNTNNRSQLGNPRRQQFSSQIDIIKIQTLFANAQDDSKQTQVLLLLKALKNRFSKLKNPYLKRQIIVQYSRHDICGITPQKYYIQKRLLVDGSQRIKQLMNQIAVDIYGIQYLSKSEKLIQNLINLLNKQIIEETNSKRFILGILQKFSYPKKSRSKMIRLGIIPLIFKIFELQKQDIQGYTLQYLTAMIMNLSLKKQSQKHFIQYKSQLVLILMNLMTNQSQQIKNYANGSLYLLLSYKQILSQSIRLGLQKKIIQFIQPYQKQLLQQDNFYGQYQYILKRIRGQIQIDSGNQSQDEDQDIPIDLDQFQEEDENIEGSQYQDDEDQDSDYISGEEDNANGEELLLKQYMLIGPDALKEHLLTRSVLDQTSKKINNMTLSINHSKRMDNIFSNKERASQQLQPELDKLIHENQQIVHKLNVGQQKQKKKML